MPGQTLYFSNPDTQAVQKVAGVIEQPTIYNLGVAEDIYNRPHRDLFEEVYADELGSSVTSEFSSGGGGGVSIPGWASWSSSGQTGSGSSNATSSRMWVFKTLVVGGTAQHSDERVHAPHRQDKIKLNYWKVIFSEASGQPTYALLSRDNYPDFSPNPPGWWTDPTA